MTLDDHLATMTPEDHAALEARVAELRVQYARAPGRTKERDRAWRNAATTAARPPVSDKVAYYNPKVEATVAPKTRGRGK